MNDFIEDYLLEKTASNSSSLENIASEVIHSYYSNVLNLATMTDGYGLDTAGNPLINANSILSDYIEFTNDNMYLGYVAPTGTLITAALYNASKTFIKIKRADALYAAGNILAKETAKYFRYVIYKPNVDYTTVMIVPGTVYPSEYVAYGVTGVSSIKDDVETNTADISTLQTDVAFLHTALNVVDNSYANTLPIDILTNVNVAPTGVFKTVKKAGGDYTTISAAVAAASDGDTIIVYPGVYEEAVSAWGKQINIVGTDKYSCILTYGAGVYDTPPLEIDSGYISNLTIIADKTIDSSAETDQNNHAYCVHIEDNHSSTRLLEFDNCIFENDLYPCVGMGLRVDFTAIFRNCKFKTNYAQCWINTQSAFGDLGCFYFHDSTVTEYLGDHQNVIIENCEIISKSGYSMNISISPTDAYLTNKVYLTCRNNHLWTLTNENTNASIAKRFVGTAGAITSNKCFLTKDSYGNNVPMLNFG